MLTNFRMLTNFSMLTWLVSLLFLIWSSDGYLTQLLKSQQKRKISAKLNAFDQASTYVRNRSSQHQLVGMKSSLVRFNQSISPRCIPYFISFISLIFPSVSFASVDESIQLLYGYNTQIPYWITWCVLLYGFYKIYFQIFRCAASW
jgi:hypothetical protein